MRRVLLTCLIGSVALNASAGRARVAGSDAQSAQVDALFADYGAKDTPGCAVGVSSGGQLLHLGGYGMADIEQGIPITPATVFNIASITKQLTAANIALLVERGALSWDTDIRTILPELPEYENPVRIRDLVYQTSGLNDYFALFYFKGLDINNFHRNEFILSEIAKQKATAYQPGSEHSYSNSNYFLLMLIVQRVSGLSLAEFSKRNLFDPLAMKDTLYRDDPDLVVSNRAESYSRSDDGQLHQVTVRNPITGEGGVYSTVSDMLRWAGNLAVNQLGGNPTAFGAAMFERPRLFDGNESPYGRGLQFNSYRGASTVGHGGTMGGYRTRLLRFPTADLNLVVLCNQLELSPYTLIRKIADIYLSDQLGPPEPEPLPPQGGTARLPDEASVRNAPWADDLQPFTGCFQSEELGATYSIAAEDGGLALTIAPGQVHQVVPDQAGAGMFRGGGADVHFTDPNAPDAFILSSRRIHGLNFRRC